MNSLRSLYSSLFNGLTSISKEIAKEKETNSRQTPADCKQEERTPKGTIASTEHSAAYYCTSQQAANYEEV